MTFAGSWATPATRRSPRATVRCARRSTWSGATSIRGLARDLAGALRPRLGRGLRHGAGAHARYRRRRLPRPARRARMALRPRRPEIGRASCRERGEVWEVVGVWKQTTGGMRTWYV